jgi:Tol biopolymer transport system component
MRFPRVFTLLAGCALAAACDSTDPSNAAPSAGFTAECDQLECAFENSSTDADGAITTYAWDFGDEGSSTEPNPTHAYAEPGGDFTVTLTVTDDDGAAATTTSVVNVTQAATGPLAAFTASCTDLTCSFTAQSSDAGAGTSEASYAWSFGDGGTGTGLNPSHTYALPGGRFNVTLTVTDDGLEATAMKQLVVSQRGLSDRGQLLFVRNDLIYTLIDGEARPLTVGARDARPAWSPDGRRIAFVRYSPDFTGNVFLMDADGANLRPLADGFESPAWSPDGSLLAVDTGFCVYECDIYLLLAGGGGAPVRVATMAAAPAWSPDGRKIAFVGLSGDDGYHSLHVMNRDGSEVTTLVAPDGRNNGAIIRPAWSPDGGRIAYATCIDARCNIFTVKVDGSAVVQITTVPRGSHASEPAWSPDGARIAFTLRSGPQLTSTSIAYVAADGSGEPVTLVSSGHSPSWRP